MDSNKMNSFLALSELFSFTKAADMLNIHQSVLSRHIRSMEVELGMELFNRNTKFVSLSPAGAIMAEGLRDLKSRYVALIEQAASAQKGYTGEIKIGVLNGMRLSGFKQILSAYEELNSDIRIILFSDSLRHLRQMLLDQSLDFVLGLQDDFDYISKLQVKLIYQIRSCLVVSKKHWLAGQDGVALHLLDFKDETFFVMPEKESAAFRTLIKLCSKEGFWPRVAVVPDLLTILLRIDAGHGVSILSESNASYGNPDLTYLHLPEFNPMRFCIIWSSENEKLNKLAFIDYLNKNIP